MLLLLPHPARAISDAAARLAIVPLSPGGSGLDPPVYSPSELTDLQFGVYIDQDLGGDIDVYLHQRAALCRATYSVELFALGADFRPSPADPGELIAGKSPVKLEADSSGAFSLARQPLESGQAYAWRAVATLPDGAGVVLGPPLFLRTEPAPDLFPALLPRESAALAEQLQRLTAEQQRAGAALRNTLAGLALYDTYPTASDTYVCTPLRNVAEAPCPAQPNPPLTGTPMLALLGELLDAVQQTQNHLRGEAPVAGELAALGQRLEDLARSVQYGPALARTKGDLGLLGTQLAGSEGSGEVEAKLALLSQTQLAIDEVIGPGTLDLAQDYRDSFVAYAAAAQSRVQRISELQPFLEVLFSKDKAQEWSTLASTQRGVLAGLADEVSRGRLSKTQLAQRIAANRKELQAKVAAKYGYVDAASGRVAESRIGKLTEADTKQLHQLEQELVQCRIALLFAAVWPD